MKLLWCFFLMTPLAFPQTIPSAPTNSPAAATRANAVAQPAPAAAPTPEQIAHMQKMLLDWPDLARYTADNAALRPPAPGENRVVFMGDSITDSWGRAVGTFFPGEPYINRGISGQTTPQMLIRFRPDVIALTPKAVVILGGINDIAGNTGPTTPAMIEGNLTSMVELAKANNIRVVLSSILPAARFPWNPGIDPVAEIVAVNRWIRDYCATRGCVYLDYYSAMVDARGGMKPELTADGVHPNAAGYRIMTPLAAKAIATALSAH